MDKILDSGQSLYYLMVCNLPMFGGGREGVRIPSLRILLHFLRATTDNGYQKKNMKLKFQKIPSLCYTYRGYTFTLTLTFTQPHSYPFSSTEPTFIGDPDGEPTPNPNSPLQP
ncbi:unnamed protein product [Camellia sinensis]